ncbi:SusC/RagA family TonB-linked outer membrane protein [Albibacterium profundi]|uniref:SusC/RagA family TonB-linked outer membrane protein n=1 Tax=Albibacterium profundi TaxID=3134906 RepID=A0ABV5CCT6_9SPHI
MKKQLLLFFVAGILIISSAYAQNRRVSGKVTSQEDGLGIPGVTVTVSGTTTGTTTDGEGFYSLDVPASATALEFSFIGYTKQTLQIGDRTTINVTLVNDATQLGEVIVTALGIQRQRNELPYAAQEVKAEEITRTRDNNFVNALSGKVAGLDIKQSGTMGGSTNVVMRGIKSMTGNNQALFVVDGAPISNANTNTSNQTTGRGGYDYGNAAADINPDDIESLTVLKGAAATALYGSRAANGVIMITTKKGKKNSMNITVNTGLTFGNIDKSTFAEYQTEYGAGYINEYSKSEYIRLAELANSDGDPDNDMDVTDFPTYGSEDGSFWFRGTPFENGNSLIVPFTEDASYGGAFDPNLMVYQWDAFDPSSPTYGQKTPWVAAKNDPSTFFETGVNSTHSITLDGGGDNATFKAGYTRNDETGILPNSKIIKNIFNLGGSYDITENLKASGTANFSKIDGLGRFGTGYSGNNVNQQFRQWWQTNVDMKEQEAAYYRNKQNITWNWSDHTAVSPIYSNNPYFTRFENYQNDTRNRYFGNFALSWTPLEWMNIVGRVTYDGSTEKQEERWAQGGADVPGYSLFNRTFSETNYDLLINFNRDISEDISFTGLLGSNIRRSELSSVYAETVGGLAFPGLYSLSNSFSPMDAPVEQYRRIGVDGIFASANFGYKDTYFLDATIRRDQSSTLPQDNNTYWYPSIAGGFIFSNLIEDKSILNYGKVRLNYAQVGADAPALSLYDTFIINFPFNGIHQTSVYSYKQNMELLPERTRSVEAGIEMAFFNSRLGFDASYYQTTSFDQIMGVSVSTATGYGFKFVNAGSIENKGFEISAYGIPVKTDNFSWTINANFSRNRNEVIDLYEGNKNLQIATFQGGVSLNATVGQPFGTFRGVDYQYIDGQKVVGEDGYYLSSDPNTVMGDINPDWTGGIQNMFTYKNFALNFLIDIKQGGDVWSLDQYYGMATGLYPETAGLNDLGNPSRLPISQGGGVILPGVKEDGTPNDIRVENYDSSVTPYGYANNPTAVGLFDASYVKLREAAITYSLPSEWLERTRAIKGIDVSLIGRNLWIIHKNLPYADPEAGLSSGNIQGYQSGAYPTVRSVGFNLRFKF